MNSIRDIAIKANAMFRHTEESAYNNGIAYAYAVREGFHQLVGDLGGFYHKTVEVPLALGQVGHDFPEDVREIDPRGVTVWWEPRRISSAVRSNGVLTVTVESDHNLYTGAKVRIEGCQDNTFNGDIEVSSVVNARQFTASQSGPDGAQNSGVVRQRPSAYALRYTKPGDFAKELKVGAGTRGLPRVYCIPHSRRIDLFPAPNEEAIALTISYDALPPADLSDSEKLPGPEWLERILIRYAAYTLGTLPKEMVQTFGDEWASAKRQWRAHVSRSRNYGLITSGLDMNNEEWRREA